MDGLSANPSGPEFAAAHRLGMELEEVQRALTSVREPPDVDWAAVLRRLGSACTGGLSPLKARLVQTAAAVDGLRRGAWREDRSIH